MKKNKHPIRKYNVTFEKDGFERKTTVLTTCGIFAERTIKNLHGKDTKIKSIVVGELTGTEIKQSKDNTE